MKKILGILLLLVSFIVITPNISQAQDRNRQYRYPNRNREYRRDRNWDNRNNRYHSSFFTVDTRIGNRLYRDTYITEYKYGIRTVRFISRLRIY